jgi:disulfide bond formation protein DsbB
MGWVRRAFAPKNWVPPQFRPYVTPGEARSMSAWPVLGSVTAAVVADEVFGWPPWAVLVSTCVLVIAWVVIATERVCARALKRLNHEHLKP